MSGSALDWLYSTQWFGVKLGLENMRRLLDAAEAMPGPGTLVLHVAGTNGKGSVCAMAESIARQGGTCTGLFTSPHLVDFRERIRVDGSMISPADLHRELDFLRRLVATWDPHPTFFELALAAALRHFKRQQCALWILETGMGGRLDATNALPSDVCVLTPIGMDHREWLGDSIEQIAGEKAGIIKPGVPVVCAAQAPEAHAVIRRAAEAAGAPLRIVENPWTGPAPALAGRHQRQNAALAVEALRQLGLPAADQILRAGLAEVRWPGRFDFQPAHRMVLDGAHNPDGAAVLAATWRDTLPGQRASLVFSALQDKDATCMLRELLPLAARILVCPADSPRTRDTASLADSARAAGFPPAEIIECATLENAIAAAKMFPETILLTGSLHFVGQAIAWIDGTDRQASSQ